MKAGTFTLMPIEALTDHRLTLIQLRVLGALFSWRDKMTNVCDMTREQIAERCGYTPQVISKATAGLERLGWLEKVGKGGRGFATRYQVKLPETVSDPGTVPGVETVSDPDTKTVSDPDTLSALNGVRSGHTQRNNNQKHIRNKTTRARFDPLTVTLPPWLSSLAWADWCAHRRETGKPITETAARMQIEQLARWREKGHNPSAIIAVSITNGWQGLFEPKGAGGQPVKRDYVQTVSAADLTV